MRRQILKNKKGHSTKSERRFCEILKKLHIPFRTKVMIAGHEVDFVIGDTAIEIDGHNQNVAKNYALIGAGYSPLHFSSWDIPNDNLIEWLQQKWPQEQVSPLRIPQLQI